MLIVLTQDARFGLSQDSLQVVHALSKCDVKHNHPEDLCESLPRDITEPTTNQPKLNSVSPGGGSISKVYMKLPGFILVRRSGVRTCQRREE